MSTPNEPTTTSSTPEPIVAQKIVDAQDKGKDTGVSTEVEAREVVGAGSGKEEGKVDETAGRRVSSDSRSGFTIWILVGCLVPGRGGEGMDDDV